jgi:hypothetical protein
MVCRRNSFERHENIVQRTNIKGTRTFRSRAGSRENNNRHHRGKRSHVGDGHVHRCRRVRLGVPTEQRTCQNEYFPPFQVVDDVNAFIRVQRACNGDGRICVTTANRYCSGVALTSHTSKSNGAATGFRLYIYFFLFDPVRQPVFSKLLQSTRSTFYFYVRCNGCGIICSTVLISITRTIHGVTLHTISQYSHRHTGIASCCVCIL